jgi:CofD-related protein of GAK system
MNAIQETRTIQMPDMVRLEQYRESPELGPHVLFFSGGTALNCVCKALKKYSHNTIHMITPFDSGGSSAVLRKAFEMPSIGDLRNRIMALADETFTGHAEIYSLFTRRFKKDADVNELRVQLSSICENEDDLIRALPGPIRQVILTQLGYFYDSMPAAFDLRGASIGNLILTGGYLKHQRHLDSIIHLISKLAGVRGTVKAIVDSDLHLAADLKDGSRVIGQHKLTGKEQPPITSPVERLYLSSDAAYLKPARTILSRNNCKLISSADLICYPPGSFYTSLIANLLPDGVAQAIAGNNCAKVYVPNIGQDPEQIGMTLDSTIRTLLHYLKMNVGPSIGTSQLLNYILLDSRYKNNLGSISLKLLCEQGIQLIDTELVSNPDVAHYDPELLASALLSLT